MILKIAAVVGVIGLVLFIGQWLIGRYSKDNEQLRKLVHVLHGSGIAVLAFLVPLDVVVGIELFILVSMFIARYLFEHFSRIAWIRYCGQVYNVGRISYGEFFFPLSAVALAYLADSKWEFAAAMLILGVADAVAALVGKKYGKKNGYLVFGQKKSIAGSSAFFVAAFFIILAFSVLHGAALGDVAFGVVVLTAGLVTIAENLGVYGSDNLLIPIVAVLLLNRF